MTQRVLTFVLTSKSLQILVRCCESLECSIVVGESSVKLSGDLSILISRSAYMHFHKNGKQLRIEVGKTPQIPEDSITKCLQKLFSLIDGTDFVDLEDGEVPVMMFLAKVLKNSGIRNQISNNLATKSKNRLQWTSKMLSDFSCVPDSEEFSFKVCDEKFECPRIIAQLLSREVSKLLLSDSSLNEFEVNLPDEYDQNEYLNAFGQLFEVLTGGTLIIPHEKSEIFKSIASQIGCSELLDSINSFEWVPTPINISNVYAKLSNLHIGQDTQQISEAIRFCATNFFQLESEKLIEIPIPYMQEVVGSIELKLKSEQQLFDFALAKLKRDGKRAITLFSAVKFEDLDSKSIKEFIETTKFDSISEAVWEALCHRLERDVTTLAQPSNRLVDHNSSKHSKSPEAIQQEQISELKLGLQNQIAECEERAVTFKMEVESVRNESSNSIRKLEEEIQEANNTIMKATADIDSLKRRPKEFNFQPHRKNNGVFSFLRSQCAGSINSLQNIIRVTASSYVNDAYRPETALEWNSTNGWGSSSPLNQWLQVEFIQNYFTLTDIFFYFYPTNFPQSISILASNEGEPTNEIKKIEFRGNGSIGYFRFAIDSATPFKVFRLLQTSRCNGGKSNCFQILSIEFFGILIYPNN